MNELLITNWDTCDTHAFYKKNIEDFPLIFSSDHNLWVANSYANCKALFSHPDAWIPRPAAPAELTRNALLLIDNLARLNDSVVHQQARLAGTILYESLKSVNPVDILTNTLAKIDINSPFDWVDEICKTLPLMCILNAFSFLDRDCEWIIDHFFFLTENNNTVISHFDIITHKLPDVPEEDVRMLVICNLIGLLIQSYDAGRGLLCNGMIRTAELKNAASKNVDMHLVERLMTETLRIDPPVHNTRRIAVKDIDCGDHLIKKGELILLVLAAANLDPAVFERPHDFDLSRVNNDAHLSFGYGAHACIAREFVIRLAATSCLYIYQNYSYIQILPQQFEYEPLKNARLLKTLNINLSNKTR